MKTDQYIDEVRLREALQVLKPDNELFEIRLLQKPKKTISGYFRDVDVAVEELKKLHLKDWNVFFSLNGIRDDCYGRIQRDCFKSPQNTTNDEEITYYEWLLVDLDPVRASEVSSTDEELEKAKGLSKRVYAYLKREGFEDPIVAMSGNGIHLLYKVGMQNTAEVKSLVERFLKALDLMFSTDDVKIDTANFNPARICKMYGTLAQKGAGADDRPHRMSYIITMPPEVRQVKKAYIEQIAATLPKEEKPQAYNQYMPKQFDIEAWMSNAGLKYRKKSHSDYTKYVLDECPFNHAHKAPDSMITVGKSGAIGFKCLHNSCQDKTWKDVRLMFEPDAYDDKYGADDERINHGWVEHKLHNRDKQIDYRIIQDDEIDMNKPVFLTAKQILDQPLETEDFIRTGIEGIDNRMRGLKKGAVSLLSGLRGNSKSTLLTGIILSAVNDGHNVICYSGELTAKNFMKWMNLQAAGKNHTQLTKYNSFYTVSQKDRELIAEWLGEHFLLYENDYGNNFVALYSRLYKQIEEQKTDLIVLDNLMSLDIRDLDMKDKYSAQKIFITELASLAKRTDTHIIFVAHPRKANGFLRLEDVSGTADLANMTDNAFIVHRNNEDFKRLSKEMFRWPDDHEAYKGTNVIEIAKDRDGGNQDVFIPLWYEKESKRLKNAESEVIKYGWETDLIEDYEDEIKF